MTLNEQQKKITKQLQSDGLDYLTEIVVANLIKEGYNFENIDIKSVSYFKRGYKNDIEQVFYDDRQDSLVFEITRNALYDTLPEGLFHDDNAYEDLIKYKDNKQWQSKKRKKREVEEAQARTFFFPFEKEFFRQRVDIELKEQFYYTNFEKDLPTLKSIVDDIWGINENLTAKQYFALFRWLPKTYQIVGNRKKTEECLSDILETNVKIEVKSASISEFEGENTPSFICGRESVLGVDTVIGNHVNDGTFRWSLAIGTLNKVQIRDFLPRGTKFNLLKIIERIFIPYEVEFETNLELERKKSPSDPDGITFELNDNTNSILGFTTIL
jgi:hypothetical protein